MKHLNQKSVSVFIRLYLVPLLPYNSRDINNIVMEMLIMSYACKTSSAGKIVGVIPFLPYSRQCKKN